MTPQVDGDDAEVLRQWPDVLVEEPGVDGAAVDQDQRARSCSSYQTRPRVSSA